MCVIIIKEKNQEKPNKEFLQKAWNTNSDGAGFMYNNKGRVIISKGYMTFKQFWKGARNLPSDSAIVYHFRIATHGGTDKTATHPFMISNVDKDLQKTYANTDLGIAHNGIISLTSNYDKKENKNNLSDTQLFIRDYVYEIQKVYKDWYRLPRWVKIVETLLGTTKIAVLDKLGNVYKFNYFVNVNGYSCSNNYFSHTYRYYDELEKYDWGNYGTKVIPMHKDDEIEYIKDYTKGYVKTHNKGKDKVNTAVKIPSDRGYVLYDEDKNEFYDIEDFLNVEIDLYDYIVVDGLTVSNLVLYTSDYRELSYRDIKLSSEYNEKVEKVN